MKRPTLICAMPLRESPVSGTSELKPFFTHGIRREDLGVAGIQFSIYLLFADGQGEWPVEVNLITVDGKKSGRPLTAVVNLEDPLKVEAVSIETGIRISRFGYNFITVDLDGETVARVPFHIFELESEGGSHDQ